MGCILQWLNDASEQIADATSTECVNVQTVIKPVGLSYVLFLRVSSEPMKLPGSGVRVHIQGIQCAASIISTSTITHYYTKSHNWWKGKSDSHWSVTEKVDRGITPAEMQTVTLRLMEHLVASPVYLSMVQT